MARLQGMCDHCIGKSVPTKLRFRHEVATDHFNTFSLQNLIWSRGLTSLGSIKGLKRTQTKLLSPVPLLLTELYRNYLPLSHSYKPLQNGILPELFTPIPVLLRRIDLHFNSTSLSLCLLPIMQKLYCLLLTNLLFFFSCSFALTRSPKPSLLRGRDKQHRDLLRLHLATSNPLLVGNNHALSLSICTLLPLHFHSHSCHYGIMKEVQ